MADVKIPRAFRAGNPADDVETAFPAVLLFGRNAAVGQKIDEVVTGFRIGWAANQVGEDLSDPLFRKVGKQSFRHHNSSPFLNVIL